MQSLPPISAFNTLTEQKEALEKPAKGPLNFFVCGPTVYDNPHIGNARTYLSFDIIVRYLRARDWEVFYLQNITNVDDKIINRARETGKTPAEVAAIFTHIYHDNEKALGITSVTLHAPTTDYIPEIVQQVQTLIRKGHAYKIEGDGYYFDLSTFAEYGKLSHRTSLQAEDAVSRIDESIQKRNKGDFALWKFKKDDFEPSWHTELGEGRPGWHIEDTATTEKHFGPQYDVHGGAVDLKFPHHEAEIAQQEAASGKKPFVKMWLHTGFLLVDGKKMSKSLGNFLTISAFLEKHPAELLRFIVASHHYHSPIDFNNSLLHQASQSLTTIRHFISRLNLIKAEGVIGTEISTETNRAEADFHTAMSDDFNTPGALAAIFGLISTMEKPLWKLNKEEVTRIKETILNLGSILGFDFSPAPIPQDIMALANTREAHRRNQQFINADTLRKELEALGYLVEDTPVGPHVYKAARG